MLRSSVLAFVLGAVVAILPTSPLRSAEFCTCARALGGACQAAWKADAVFVGTVTAIEDLGPGERFTTPFVSRRVRLGRTETFLGESFEDATVLTGWGGGDCGYPFVVGRAYLVYAYRGTDGALHTGICSRTAEVRDRRDDLEYLRSLTTTAVSTTGRLFGRVRRLEQSLPTRAERDVPMPGVRLRAIGDAGTFEVRSSDDGTFEIGVPPGGYAIEVEAPEGHYAIVWPSPAELANRRACVGIGVTLRFDGRVTGRVLSASGEPMPGAVLSLARVPEPPGSGSV